jgi:hypothetical protein
MWLQLWIVTELRQGSLISAYDGMSDGKNNRSGSRTQRILLGLVARGESRLPCICSCDRRHSALPHLLSSTTTSCTGMGKLSAESREV